MTAISPLLQNRISTPSPNVNPHHEKAYKDLQKKANEVKPNEPKARLVKEGMLGNPVTAVIDTAKDGGNFFKAVATGEMSDNSLGRINDLGLKIGSAIIASFLALHSKSKTDSIMRFIGGGTFIAVMSLWPKLFINIPARLVHGFRIDRKYISAQGDKKDVGLDNQFLVWDAFPEKELRKDAQRAGIDYDSENGKEKIQRKIQKTMLQNRTLWMATAGFATPLLTALICNFAEPKVKQAIVKHDMKKAQEALKNFDSFMASVRPDVQNAEHIKTLLSEGLQAQDLTTNLKDTNLAPEIKESNFFTQLAKLLEPVDFVEKAKDSDDMKAVMTVKTSDLAERLQELYEKLTRVDAKDFDFEKIKFESGKGGIFAQFGGTTTGLNGEAAIDSKEKLVRIKQALEDGCTVEQARKVLKDNGVAKPSEVISQLKHDRSKFDEVVQNLNGAVGQLRARLKAYLDVMNPVLGSKTESAYTLKIRDTLNATYKALGLDKKAKAIKGEKVLGTGSYEDIMGIVSKAVQDAVKAADTDDKYKDLLLKMSNGPVDEEIQKMAKNLLGDETLNTVLKDGFEIKGLEDCKEIQDSIFKSLIGTTDGENGLIGSLKLFIRQRTDDIEAIKTKGILCANFERRLLKGDLKDLLTPEDVAVARKILYDGTASTAFCKAYTFKNIGDYNEFAKVLFNKEQFGLEAGLFGDKLNIGQIVDDLKGIFTTKVGSEMSKLNTNLPPTEIFMKTGSTVDHIKRLTKEYLNNKSWLKLFGPMAIILVAVTLLVQPMFGKIDKEFPKEDGGAK